ncbi:phosphoribosylanthranilate isomerase [Alkalibacterium sp. f15]|uniref:phosphoribosylanthranilate isomerase n=1 Tax=Alkalibacterium sp. f15 TaxID=3414029 RepID=UPI003BF81185
MLVKICGIQTPETAQVAAAAGADFIGLVFAASKRQVTIDEARKIKNSLSHTRVKVVGVFRNQPIKEVNQISRELGLDYVQLHGEESVTECQQINAPLIKALSFEEISEAKHYRQVADYILIDSPKPGSGETFDWTMLKDKNEDFPYFLAGGLSAENIAEAIQHLQPLGVDVSSGVETDGSKDAEKIRRFTHQVKQGE